MLLLVRVTYPGRSAAVAGSLTPVAGAGDIINGEVAIWIRLNSAL